MAVDRTRLPDLGPEPGYVFPAATKATLSNGLRVWTVERRRLPVVSFLVLLPVGSAADPATRPGLASLTGRLLDEGCAGRSGAELHDALGRIGGQLDVEVTADATVITLTALSRFTDQALELLADVVRRPRFEPAEFERVRGLRQHRLLQLRDVPSAVADRTLVEAAYTAHPYGHRAIGTEEGLESTSVADVMAFHEAAYRPSRATVIAVGDGSHATLSASVEAVLGAWPEPTSTSPVDAALTALGTGPLGQDTRVLLAHRGGAAQSELRVGHPTLSRTTSHYHALLVLNMVLGGQFVSRINLNLREEKGYTYGAGTAFDLRRGPGLFYAHASVETGATAAAVAELLAEIRAIRDQRPPTDDEMAAAKTALTRGYPRGFETVDQVARGLAKLALHDLPDDSFTQFIPRVTAVDRPAVLEAAEASIDPGRLIIVIVGDRAAVSPSLRQLDLGDPVPVEVTPVARAR